MDSAGEPALRLDDLALGLLKKPQYKYEVMSQSGAATALGVDFWANEVDLKRNAEETKDLKKQMESIRENFAQQTLMLIQKSADITALQAKTEQQTSDLIHKSQEITALQERQNNTRSNIRRNFRISRLESALYLPLDAR